MSNSLEDERNSLAQLLSGGFIVQKWGCHQKSYIPIQDLGNYDNSDISDENSDISNDSYFSDDSDKDSDISYDSDISDHSGENSYNSNQM